MASVVQTEDVLGREPHIEGARIGMLDVYELVGSGPSPTDVADQLECSLAEVYRVLAFYYEQPDEMRAFRQVREMSRADLTDDKLSPPELAQ